MTSPMISHAKNRSQVMTGSPDMSSVQKKRFRMGTEIPPGARKPRRRSGSRKRKISTPIETSTKAKSVPIFDKSASVPISSIPLGMATRKPATQVATAGGGYRGGTLPNQRGKSRSRDMANQTLA